MNNKVGLGFYNKWMFNDIYLVITSMLLALMGFNLLGKAVILSGINFWFALIYSIILLAASIYSQSLSGLDNSI